MVRGEGGVAQSTTQPQHPDIALDSMGTYYHKKLWAHIGTLGDTCDGEWYPRLFVDEDEDSFPNAERNLYQMFAAYEGFLEGEDLSSGSWVEIGTDLTGDQKITVSDVVGDLRAWGVQDIATGRTLIWVDNAAYTWKAMVEGSTVNSASGKLVIGGFDLGKKYVVQYWDPYQNGSMQSGFDLGSARYVRIDGSVLVSIEELTSDILLKVIEVMPVYLPVVALN
jgi:hypothetical protein